MARSNNESGLPVRKSNDTHGLSGEGLLDEREVELIGAGIEQVRAGDLHFRVAQPCDGLLAGRWNQAEVHTGTGSRFGQDRETGITAG